MSRDIYGLGKTGSLSTKESRLLNEAYAAFSQRKLFPLISKMAELEKLPSLS